MALQHALDRLLIHSPIPDEDRKTLESLPVEERLFEPGSFIIREGDFPRELLILKSGFCIRHKISKDGYRQIVGVNIAGDIVNLHNLCLDESDHNVQMLTRSIVAAVSKDEVLFLLHRRGAIGAAFFAASLVDSSIYREWILNNGRRDSRTRIGHLLCELAVRLEVSGIGSGQAYDLPMTQEQLGDAVGITAVHVNRSLKSLARDGLINQVGRRISFPNWNRLKDAVGFNARYLYVRPPSQWGSQTPS